MSSAYSLGCRLVGGPDAQQQYGQAGGIAYASDRVEPRSKTLQRLRTRRLMRCSPRNHPLVTDVADGTGAINHGSIMPCSRDSAHDTRHPIREKRTKTHAHRPLPHPPRLLPPQQKTNPVHSPSSPFRSTASDWPRLPLARAQREPLLPRKRSQSIPAFSTLDIAYREPHSAYRTPHSALNPPPAKGHSWYPTTTSRTHALVWVCAGAGVDGEAGVRNSRHCPTTQSCQGRRRRRWAYERRNKGYR